MDPTQKEIDGLTFVIGKIPGRQSLIVFHRLARTVFPAVGLALKDVLSAEVDFDELDAGDLVTSLSDALPRLFQDLKEADLNTLIDDLLKNVLIIHEGKASAMLPKLETVMTGKTFTTFKVMAASVVENYGGFLEGAEFAALLQKVEGRSKSKPTPSPSTSSSAGPSGAS